MGTVISVAGEGALNGYNRDRYCSDPGGIRARCCKVSNSIGVMYFGSTNDISLRIMLLSTPHTLNYEFSDSLPYQGGLISAHACKDDVVYTLVSH